MKEFDYTKWDNKPREMCPDVNVDVELDGNNSTLKMEANTDEELQRINVNLYQILKQVGYV